MVLVVRKLCSTVAVISLVTLGGLAHAGTVTVEATDDIWLAGQAPGATVTGYFGTDTAPANSPVQIKLTASTLTFSATGSTSVDGSAFGGPDGAAGYPDQSGFSPSPWSGDYDGPASALVGVFVGSTAPTLSSSGGYQGPDFVAGADYQSPGNTGPGAYSPSLDQIFIIGDGAGETFTAPTGATSLYIATADSLGASGGDVGSLSVTFTGGTAVPEPAAWATMLLGFGLAGGSLRALRRKTRAMAA
jgi:hypothetical protein